MNKNLMTIDPIKDFALSAFSSDKKKVKNIPTVNGIGMKAKMLSLNKERHSKTTPNTTKTASTASRVMSLILPILFTAKV